MWSHATPGPPWACPSATSGRRLARSRRNSTWSDPMFCAVSASWARDVAGSPGYGIVDTGAGRGIQGGLGSGEQAQWATIYASVPDVEATLARAGELGGSRVYGPPPVDDQLGPGARRDPPGNPFPGYPTSPQHPPHPRSPHTPT